MRQDKEAAFLAFLGEVKKVVAENPARIISAVLNFHNPSFYVFCPSRDRHSAYLDCASENEVTDLPRVRRLIFTLVPNVADDVADGYCDAIQGGPTQASALVIECLSGSSHIQRLDWR